MTKWIRTAHMISPIHIHLPYDYGHKWALNHFDCDESTARHTVIMCFHFTLKFLRCFSYMVAY